MPTPCSYWFPRLAARAISGFAVLLVVGLARAQTGLDDQTVPFDPTILQTIANILAQWGWGGTVITILAGLFILGATIDQFWPDEAQPEVVRRVLNVFTLGLTWARKQIESTVRKPGGGGG